jgi:AcrR family transcriptional regulator
MQIRREAISGRRQEPRPASRIKGNAVLNHRRPAFLTQLKLPILDIRVYYLIESFDLEIRAEGDVAVPRPAKFTPDAILNAAAEIVAARGAGATTMGEIAAKLGAPSGSLYHRFQSRDELLGRLWLQKATFFQNAFARALDEADPRKAAVEAALSLPRAVRADFAGARIMLLHRREDFMSDGWPKPMQEEAARLGQQVRDVMNQFTSRLFNANTKAARVATRFAILDIPFAAVRRYVGANEVPPLEIDRLIATAVNAILDQHAAGARKRGG